VKAKLNAFWNSALNNQLQASVAFIPRMDSLLVTWENGSASNPFYMWFVPLNIYLV